MRLLSNITFLIAVLAVAGCGAKTPIQPPPPPPPPPELAISCPTAMVREATSPQGTDVHFDTPTVTGGRAPHNVQCDPGSSNMFAIGDTTVTCTATDAEMRQASCGFVVTVRVSRTIAKTKFTAFGDSITDGTISLAPLVMLDGPETYPFKLEQMLRQQYAAQSIEVINRGQGGERTDRALTRFITVLETDKPEALLLLEGINNINGLATSTQARALRSMITEAQQRGVPVIVATVMPVLTTWDHYQPGNTSEKIRALNAEIFSLAARFDLGLPVDLYSIFQAEPHLIGKDGLHPTPEGQTRIAEAFRDEIARRYGSDSTTSLYSALRPRR
jgi:lysophospholipase L1-like esterase